MTIRNLKIGSYTVTEETNWNWRCGTTGGSQSITLQGAQTNEVRFTNHRQQFQMAERKCVQRALKIEKGDGDYVSGST